MIVWTFVLIFIFGLGTPETLLAQDTEAKPDTIEITDSEAVVASSTCLRLRPVQDLSEIETCSVYVIPGGHRPTQCSLSGKRIQPDVILEFNRALPTDKKQWLYIERLEARTDSAQFRITHGLLSIPGPVGTVKKGRSSNEIEITVTRSVKSDLTTSDVTVTAGKDRVGIESIVDRKGVGGNETIVVRLNRSLKHGTSVRAVVASSNTGANPVVATGTFKNKPPATKGDAMLYGEFSLIGSTGEWDPVYTVDAALNVALRRDIIARWNVLFETSLFWNSELDENARKVSMGVPIQRYFFLSDNGRNGLDLSFKPVMQADRNFENANVGLDVEGVVELDSLIGNRYHVKFGAGVETGQNIGIDNSIFAAEVGDLTEKYVFLRPKVSLDVALQTADDDVYPRLVVHVPATLRFLMRDEAFLTDQEVDDKKIVTYNRGPYPVVEPSATVPFTEHFGITGKFTYGHRPAFFAEEDRFTLALVAKW